MARPRTTATAHHSRGRHPARGTIRRGRGIEIMSWSLFGCCCACLRPGRHRTLRRSGTCPQVWTHPQLVKLTTAAVASCFAASGFSALGSRPGAGRKALHRCQALCPGELSSRPNGRRVSFQRGAHTGKKSVRLKAGGVPAFSPSAHGSGIPRVLCSLGLEGVVGWQRERLWNG